MLPGESDVRHSGSWRKAIQPPRSAIFADGHSYSWDPCGWHCPPGYCTLGVSSPVAISTRSTIRIMATRCLSARLSHSAFPNQDPTTGMFDGSYCTLPGTDADKARLMAPHRIIGVAADIDDNHIVPEPTVTVYDFAEI